jgi:uncharacterized membrane protein
MKLRLPLTVSFLVVAIMAAASLWAWNVLPANAVFPTHWGMDGKVNGTMGKEWGLSILPGIALFVTFMLAIVPRIEPQKENLIASRKAFFAFWLSGLVVLAASHALIIASALGYPVDVPGTLIILLPISIAAAGNYLGKARPNFFIGVRTPWTLSSATSWEKTHRMLGRLFVLSGIIVLAVRFAIGTEAAFLAMAGTITASAILAIISSYVFWKNDPARRML